MNFAAASVWKEFLRSAFWLLMLCLILYSCSDRRPVAKAGPGEGEPCYDAAAVADEGTAADCAPGMGVEFGGMSDGVATVLCRRPSSPKVPEWTGPP